MSDGARRGRKPRTFASSDRATPRCIAGVVLLTQRERRGPTAGPRLSPLAVPFPPGMRPAARSLGLAARSTRQEAGQGLPSAELDRHSGDARQDQASDDGADEACTRDGAPEGERDHAPEPTTCRTRAPASPDAPPSTCPYAIAASDGREAPMLCVRRDSAGKARSPEVTRCVG